MNYKSALAATATAVSLLASAAAFAGGSVYTGYAFALPVPLPNTHADYGIIDDGPIIKGGPIISDGVPSMPAKTTAYIFVAPRHYGPGSVDVYVSPDGSYRRLSPDHRHYYSSQLP